MKYDEFRKLARNELLTEYYDTHRISFRKLGKEIFNISGQRAHQIYWKEKAGAEQERLGAEND